jgi:class 3 adenylate cyclase
MGNRSPVVRYAPSPDGQIAYGLVGNGPVDLVLMSSGAWNVDLMWEQPQQAEFLSRLAEFARVVILQPRGYAMSDAFPAAAPPAMEEWALDTRYVMDAAAMDRAALVSINEVVPFALMGAATFPSRVESLVLIDGMARLARADDYAFGYPPAELAKIDAFLAPMWGTGRVMAQVVPERAQDPLFLDWAARAERGTLSPAMFAYGRRLVASADVRGLLPMVQCRALVVAHARNAYLGPEHGRYLAEHLPTAEYVERPGACGLPWFHDAEWTLEAVETFLTGRRTARIDFEDRVLATVLFTDIVDSTQHAASVGDSRWQRLLEDHDATVRRQLERYRGEYVVSTGDGMLAVFDGPARAIRCALALHEEMRRLGLNIRTGLHTGEVIRRNGDVHGIAVAIGARVMAEAGAGEVLVSHAVPPLVAGSGLEFTDLGVRPLKGVPGEWRLHSVVA